MGVLSRFRRREQQPAVVVQDGEPSQNTSSRRIHTNNMETWGDRDAKVEVTQPEGFLMKVIPLVWHFPTSNRLPDAFMVTLFVLARLPYMPRWTCPQTRCTRC